MIRICQLTRKQKIKKLFVKLKQEKEAPKGKER